MKSSPPGLALRQNEPLECSTTKGGQTFLASLLLPRGRSTSACKTAVRPMRVQPRRIWNVARYEALASDPTLSCHCHFALRRTAGDPTRPARMPTYINRPSTFRCDGPIISSLASQRRDRSGLKPSATLLSGLRQCRHRPTTACPRSAGVPSRSWWAIRLGPLDEPPGPAASYSSVRSPESP